MKKLRQKLLHDYTKTIEEKSYVHAKGLDVFAGQVICEKSRKLKSAIDKVFKGTEVIVEESVLNKQKTCFVAFGMMQILIILFVVYKVCFHRHEVLVLLFLRSSYFQTHSLSPVNIQFQ